MLDFYEILGVDSDATNTDMKAAYRRVAKIFHADRFDDTTPDAVRREAERRMKLVNEAYP